ncbi:Arogenate dehydrogenase 2, chloroplastic [Apostasia shenzhenica]|uniref:Arogenate dehydrogenase 2, chloroplastic n=1 Tax=Apostasia shenzhenica TaxID=1088818 RepID=A0A2H9ZV99_9ASPA|nr:Arogenate dehydrogenase 2, chloroplastic [Apostasia shenzhenica]
MASSSSSSSSSSLHLFPTTSNLITQTSKQRSLHLPFQHSQNTHHQNSSIHSTLRLHPAPHRRRSNVSCIAAALPSAEEEESLGPLRIAIVGFGNFGRFIAQGFRRQGHTVIATSRTDYGEYCRQHGVLFVRSVDEVCEEEPDIVVICSSILSTESVVRSIPFEKLRPETIFADVLSVKQFPRNLFLEVLPPEFGIVCTHPMFGPESGKDGWAALPFVFDRVRLAAGDARQARNCRRFLRMFEDESHNADLCLDVRCISPLAYIIATVPNDLSLSEGCRMVEMSCEEHDRHAAGSQFITHTIGRILSHLNLESTPINTKGYETLLKLTENTVSDSFDLYYGLFMYNVNATEQIENLDRAFETVKQKLFGRLHDILRKQIVDRAPTPMKEKGERKKKTNLNPSFLSHSEKIKDLSIRI